LGDNGAAIRWQSGNLSLDDDYFHQNQEGLLGTPLRFGTGNLSINQSEFGFNGSGNGQTHNLYVAYAHSLTIINSYFHDAVIGHEIKSRANINTIENNIIAGNNSHDSMHVDLPNGGTDLVSGNMIEKGLGSENPRFIAFGEGPTLGVGSEWTGSSLTIKDNIFDNQYGSRAQALWNPDNLPVSAPDNQLYDLPLIAPFTAAAGNTELTKPPPFDPTHPWLWLS
jgi:hypothetical protein